MQDPHPTPEHWELLSGERILVRVDDVGPDNSELNDTIRELERLQRPFLVGVIPEQLAPPTVDLLRTFRHGMVWQHGFRHMNRSSSPRYSEFPDDFPNAIVMEELRRGREKIEQLLARTPLGYIPPWNHLSAIVCSCLEALGFQLVSANAKCANPPTSLRALHAAVDPIHWSSPPLVKPAAVVRRELRAALAKQSPAVVTLHPAQMTRANTQTLMGLIEEARRIR